MTGAAGAVGKEVDAYYLGTTDIPGNVITPIQLKGDNYDEWSRAIRTALRSKHKYGFLEGTITKPTDETKLEDWYTVHSMLQSWLMNTIEPSIRSTLTYYEDARELWVSLKARYGVVNGTTRICQLKAALGECRQSKTETVASYFGRMSRIWDELATYVTLPTCRCQGCKCGLLAKYQSVITEDRLHWFMLGLDGAYSSVRSQLLNQDPLPGLERAYQIVAEEERLLESYDRISSLRDSILHRILSFLPSCRDVVRTEILSKRWKSLWIGSSIFEISDIRCSSTACCWNFVDKVLLLRNGSGIQQFKITLTSYATSSSRAQSLIATLVRHRIQHLDISLRVEDQFTLPSSIFDCQSLGILKLEISKESRRKLTLELPDHISLPCLKVLCLYGFAFPNAESIENLFSCCPILEQLTLERCKWIHRNSVNISIPSLKSLTMFDSLEEDDPIDDHDSCYIKVEAPALGSFNYGGTSISEFYLSKLQSIEKFQLSLSYSRHSFNDSRVQSLIVAAVSLEVKQLHITVPDKFSLPCSIFDCHSLSILKLSMRCTLELPIHISLPSLKVLHLSNYFEFPDAKSIEKLFSSCPVLEELSLLNCRLIQQNDISISIPSLKSLTMVDSFEKHDLPKSSCYIKVEAPSLQSFNYTGCLTHHLYLTKMSSSSIKACIDMVRTNYYVGITTPRLVKLLQALENMISLTISNRTVELLFLLADTDSDHFPVFHHLESLLLSCRLTGRVFQGLLKFISFFTPNLRTIKFSEGVDRTICHDGIKLMPKPLPNCFSSSLKLLELGNVFGHSHQVFFLTSFLESAASLQKINIFQSKYITVDMQQVLRDEVEKLSTRFKHCAINIVR